ncbi:hypothetical protein G2W53_044735 [Senna tora]|uniref:Uncharacterized protein n=1 Tax=Senna tora TaxID=362788 RepID=A0A834SHC3_9FABA|nr:hypothetical protein G2W53_044735 [Senna tora]
MNLNALWQSPQILRFLKTLIVAPLGSFIIPKTTASFSLWVDKAYSLCSDSISCSTNFVSGTYPNFLIKSTSCSRYLYTACTSGCTVSSTKKTWTLFSTSIQLQPGVRRFHHAVALAQRAVQRLECLNLCSHECDNQQEEPPKLMTLARKALIQLDYLLQRTYQHGRTNQPYEHNDLLLGFNPSSPKPFCARPDIITVHVKRFLSGMSLKMDLASSKCPVLMYPDRIEFHETISFMGILLKISLASTILPNLQYNVTNALFTDNKKSDVGIPILWNSPGKHFPEHFKCRFIKPMMHITRNHCIPGNLNLFSHPIKNCWQCFSSSAMSANALSTLERLAGITNVGRFTIDIDQAVEDVTPWHEPRSYHVGMDGSCQVTIDGAERAA